MAFPSLPLSIVAIATIIAAMVAGWISWHAIEKPAINWVNNWTRSKWRNRQTALQWHRKSASDEVVTS
jgi:peptidoglycan/LPS O-acetylase OafA/YrhL